jgi:hypothetical protein
MPFPPKDIAADEVVSAKKEKECPNTDIVEVAVLDVEVVVR